MSSEMAACQFSEVLTEPESVSRLRTKYHSLRRQVCLIQSISVLFCFSCCVFTLLYHAFPPTCKENESNKPPTFDRRRGNEMDSTKASIPTPKNTLTSFTRLTVNDKVHFTEEKGYVPWMYTPEYPSPNHTRYFVLDPDNVSLTVKMDGTYKVSLQITYRGVGVNTEKISLQHDILHYSEAYPKDLPLLTHMETVNLNNWWKCLFSEGIFLLKSGDKLRVRSNSLKYIDKKGTISQKTAFMAYPHFST